MLLGEELNDSRGYSDYMNAFYGYYTVRSRLIPLQLVEYYYYVKSFFYYYSLYPASPDAKTDQINPIAEKTEAASTCMNSKKSKGFKSSILKDDATA